MRFRQLDLNLLHALSVLIEERSVSRAAERLHVSQPTMSAVLARLREFFRDPLLVQQGRTMVPSSLALEFRPMLREVLMHVNVMIAASHGFDPGKSERSFCISTSDYFAMTLLPRLIALVRADAPQVNFEIVTSMDGFSRPGESSEVDVVVAPAEFLIPGHPSTFLYHEPYVIMGWEGNPLVQGPMTEDEFYAAAHVAITPSNGWSISDAFLQSRGREHRVEIRVSSFLYVPALITGSPRIMMLPRRLAVAFAAIHPIRFVDLPFEFAGFQAMVQHHSSRGSDPGIGWLISRIRQAVGIDNPDIAI